MERFRDIGSAKMLIGNQKLLFIFVDDDGASPWTRELRKPVEEKIERSLHWLKGQAQGYGIRLQLQHVCLPLGSIACNAGGRIDETDYCSGPGHSTWQNTVITGLTKLGSVAERWDDLFVSSGLTLSGLEGSAVFFCVRRYVPSVAFPFCQGQHMEFERERGIIYDNGGAAGQWYLDSQIAHEILHLCGAVDLAPEKAPDVIKAFVNQYPNDVMHTPTQQAIDKYCVGNLTAYLVGWTQTRPAYLKKASG